MGNRIQLFAEEEAVPETPTDHCDSRPTLEEAQEMLCYRKTDSARSVCMTTISLKTYKLFACFLSDICAEIG